MLSYLVNCILHFDCGYATKREEMCIRERTGDGKREERESEADC